SHSETSPSFPQRLSNKACYKFTFSHLADAFIQSDLHMYTHFTFTLMAHCTSGAIRGSVCCSRTLRQGIELATFCLLTDFSTSCTTVALGMDTHKLMATDLG